MYTFRNPFGNRINTILWLGAKKNQRQLSDDSNFCSPHFNLLLLNYKLLWYTTRVVLSYFKRDS